VFEALNCRDNPPYAAPSSADNSGTVVRTVQAPQQAMGYVACQGALRKPPVIAEAAQEISGIGAAISLGTLAPRSRFKRGLLADMPLAGISC